MKIKLAILLTANGATLVAWRLPVMLKQFMKGILTTLLIGAAVAGALYYFLDKEKAEELFSDLKDKAKGAYDEASEHIAGMKKEVNGVVG